MGLVHKVESCGAWSMVIMVNCKMSVSDEEMKVSNGTH